MKVTKAIIALLLCMASTVSLTAADTHYWGNNQQIPLLLSEESIAVKLDPGPSGQAGMAAIYSEEAIDHTVEPSGIGGGFGVYTVLPGYDVDSLIAHLESQAGIYLVNYVYLAEDSSEIMVTDKISICFKQQTTQQQIDSVLDAHNMLVDRVFEIEPPIYVIKITDQSDMKVLEMANALYSSSLTHFSHPSFVAEIERFYTPNDPYYYYQYQLHNTGQYGGIPGADADVERAWDLAGTMGDSNLIVGIIDDGIDYVHLPHEDLPPSRVWGGVDLAGDLPPDSNGGVIIPDYNYSPGDSCAHGMSVAGIIAATRNNNIGVSGIAPNVAIWAVKIFHSDNECSSSGVGSDIIANAILWCFERGTDIVNMSFGYRRGPNFWLDDIAWMIRYSADHGRLGKGTVFVGSAGNTAYRPYNNGYVVFPGRMPEVIAVGATTNRDSIWYYSPRDDELDMVATSGDVVWAINDFRGDVWTVDRMGAKGINPVYFSCNPDNQSYNCKFGGTSAAAPVVSGTAALLLSIDSNLTRLDVRNILLQSAEDSINLFDPVGYDYNYGHGRANAAEAVLLAQNWTACNWLIGDADGSGIYEITDAVYIVSYVFTPGSPAPTPHPIGSGDPDCNGIVELTDAIYMLNYVMVPGAPPPGDPDNDGYSDCTCYDYF